MNKTKQNNNKIECYIPNIRLLWNSSSQLNGSACFLGSWNKTKKKNITRYIELHKYVFVPMGPFEHVLRRFKIDSTKKERKKKIAARKMHVQTIRNKYDPNEPKLNHKQYELCWTLCGSDRCSDNFQFETLVKTTVSKCAIVETPPYKDRFNNKHPIMSQIWSTSFFFFTFSQLKI